MATELEQFVEANKTRLGEINASNPPLYSALTLALDYLNKNYFGGTSEINVELPSVTTQITESPQANTTQANERIFTDSELEKLIFDQVWTGLDFREIKIELKTDVQKTNFLNLIKYLNKNSFKYNGIELGANYYYVDEDLVIFIDDKQKDFNESPYTQLFYNEIFEDLLKAQPKTTEVIPTFWDKAFCSKDWTTKIDYNYLIKALKSNRRSKDMKVEISRAFGEICYLKENTKEYLEAIDYYINNTSVTKYVYRYTFDPKVKEIFDKNGFDEYDVIQFSDLFTTEWTMSLVFPMFEQALKIDTIVDELIKYYNEKIGQPVTEQTTTTPNIPSQPNTSNFKFKVGDIVEIVSKGEIYSTYAQAFKDLNFANKVNNSFESEEGDIAIVERTYLTGMNVNAYKIVMKSGKHLGKEYLFSEEGLELFQGQMPQIIDESKIESISFKNIETTEETTQSTNEEDFEDLANELDTLDF